MGTERETGTGPLGAGMRCREINRKKNVQRDEGEGEGAPHKGKIFTVQSLDRELKNQDKVIFAGGG